MQRQLLPATHGSRTVTNVAEAQQVRNKAKGACDNCKTKKKGCNRRRPKCSLCSRSGLTCIYASDRVQTNPAAALRRELNNTKHQLREHSDFITYLCSVSEAEALAAIRHLKTSTANGTYRPSEINLSRAIISPTESGIEFELIVQHPCVYPELSPPPGPNNIYAASLFEQAIRDPLSFGPVPPILYCDLRLGQLSVASWSQVSISNELDASILSLYLEQYHPIIGCFDIDLFLSDLLQQKTDFCSPFLFSALMSLACQSYTHIDSNSSRISMEFFEEAEGLWRDGIRDSAIDLAGLNYLSLAACWNGKVDLGNQILIPEARALAKRLNLLDVHPSEELISSFKSLPPKEIKFLSYLAWGTYNWQTLGAPYLPRPPIEYPPVLPIPGELENIASNWPPHPLPSYIGYTFTAASKLFVIAQEIEAIYAIIHTGRLVDRIPPGFVECKYQKLLDLADSLPQQVAYSNNRASHIFLFHAVYHTTILNLFRPFIQHPFIFRLQSFSSVDGTSATIFSASLKQLKRLLYDYRTQVPLHLLRNCIFYAAVIHVCSVVMREARINTWVFYFRLCFDYYKDLYVQFRVFQDFMPAHLSVALEAGGITAREARLLLEEFEACGKHHEELDEIAKPISLVDFEAGIQGHGEGTVRLLAAKLEEQLMFDEFVADDVI